MNTLPIIAGDKLLLPYADIILRRKEQAQRKYDEFTQNGKHRLCDVMSNHLFYGLHRTESGWTLREWAPNAVCIYLIGDFNQWKPDSRYKLELIGGGRWQLNLPNNALQHGVLYKLLIQWNGGSGERLPSHVRRVVQDKDTHIFSAQVWQPHTKYQWKYANPFHIKNPLIYEAHVGMATEKYAVGTYNEFRSNVLPRIARLGYNMLQLMAIQEHPYYGSFGYQVSNFYAPSSRYGTPEELMALIDTAHSMGIAVIMDVVHSHSVKNDNEGLSIFDGTEYLYFHSGVRGRHPVWDSRCFDYSKNEVLAFLLSNLNYWLSDYHFDGFRFDGVTSMLYLNHGIGVDFINYSQYYDGSQDEDVLTYLWLANRLIHEVNSNAVSIAEDVSGMPGLAASAESGGIGFDYRMSMGVADFWIKNLKTKRDEDWHVGDIFFALTNKRDDERTISYAECHDQAMVGDKTIAFWLLDKEMYSGMSKLQSATPLIERGIALHKLIRFVTLAAADSGYLCFMGNEWGHPEWIDFPRAGNNWDYHYARRQWTLADNSDLRYQQLLEWDVEMLNFCRRYDIFASKPFAIVQNICDQMLVFKRGDAVFAFNFSPDKSFADYGFEIDAGRYNLLLCSDDAEFGGLNRVDKKAPYITEAKNGRNYLRLYLPSRVAVGLRRVVG